MKHLNKHVTRKTVAYILLLLSLTLTLSTGGTEHLGWLFILLAFTSVSLLWFMYEENTINQLKKKNSNTRVWVRGE